MIRTNPVLHSIFLLLFLGLIMIASGAAFCQEGNLPPSTTIPVRFTHTLQAGKAKPGDPVTAKTMEIVNLRSGQVLPKGTVLRGHVVDSRAFTFDPTPYAVQAPSKLSIHFDSIAGESLSGPLNVSVRALSNEVDSHDATVPQGLDESDPVGTMVQIGGDHFSPNGKEVFSSEDDIVGYNRKRGVFARLIPNEYMNRYTSSHCDGTTTEQSVAIFSASACGLYGFDTVYMPENGSGDGGSFALESRGHTVKLYARSAALLEVLPMPSQNYP